MGERTRTELSSVEASTKATGDTVEVILGNVGSTKLADFDQWDVILQYTDTGSVYRTRWYAYGAGDNTWTVSGIYLDASASTAEVIDPDILNPGEEIVIWVSVDPSVKLSTTNYATVATPNGITATTVFTR